MTVIEHRELGLGSDGVGRLPRGIASRCISKDEQEPARCSGTGMESRAGGPIDTVTQGLGEVEA